MPVVASLKGTATFLFEKENIETRLLQANLGHGCFTLTITSNHIIVGCGPANLFISLCYVDVRPAEVQIH